MSTTIEEQAPAQGVQPSSARRLVTTAVTVLASVGLVLGGAGIANAATFDKPYSEDHLVDVTGAGVQQISDTYYTLNVAESDGVITVEGAAFDTANQPAVPTYIPPVYYPTGGAPSTAGVYAILGRASSLPSQAGSVSSHRTAADSVWVHDGTLDQVLPGSEASWTNFADGTFTVDLDVEWQFNGSTGEYELYSAQLGDYFPAWDDDSVFQIYSTSSLGTTSADSEWVINIELIDE